VVEMEWYYATRTFGAILVGIALLIVFIAARQRKGRVALLMLPMAFWFMFWLTWQEFRYDYVHAWIGGNSGIPSNAYLVYGLFEDVFAVVVCLLPLMLIFKKDNPAITTTESEEPPKPVE
jgi:hypothetical protein